MSIIKEFYEGNMRPSEVNYKNYKYSLAAAQCDQFIAKLKETIDEKQTQQLDELIARYEIMEFEYGKEMFAVGFAMGVKFTAEGFCSDTKNFP